MILNTDGNYIYIQVPPRYNCTYSKLLIKVSDVGDELTSNCSCNKQNDIMDIWDNFQTACIAFFNGDVASGDIIINDINTKLNFNCTL